MRCRTPRSWGRVGGRRAFPRLRPTASRGPPVRRAAPVADTSAGADTREYVRRVRTGHPRTRILVRVGALARWMVRAFARAFPLPSKALTASRAGIVIVANRGPNDF